MLWKRSTSYGLYPRIRPNALLVSGPGRSGTTILVRLIGAHPRVLGIQRECHTMADFARIAAAHCTGPEAAHLRSCLAIPEDTFRRRLASFAFESCAGHPGIKGRILQQLKRTVMGGAETYWCAKTKPSRSAISGFKVLFPNVRFVHIIRNGVDTVYSRMRYPAFRHLSFEEQCEAWCGEISFYRTLREADGVLVVRHEDLTNRVRDTVRHILDFCGLEWADESLECARTEYVHPLDAGTQRVESVAEQIQAREPVWGQWSRDKRQVFQRICGPAMAELGYGYSPAAWTRAG